MVSPAKGEGLSLPSLKFHTNLFFTSTKWFLRSAPDDRYENIVNNYFMTSMDICKAAYSLVVHMIIQGSVYVVVAWMHP